MWLFRWRLLRSTDRQCCLGFIFSAVGILKLVQCILSKFGLWKSRSWRHLYSWEIISWCFVLTCIIVLIAVIYWHVIVLMFAADVGHVPSGPAGDDVDDDDVPGRAVRNVLKGVGSNWPGYFVLRKCCWLTDLLNPTDWLIDMADWLTSMVRKFDKVVDWLTDRLSGWLTVCLSDCLSDWLTDWVVDCLSGWLTGCLADCICLTDCNCLTEWLTDWLMTDWLIVWLTDWSQEWLTDWLSDCLTNWLIILLNESAYYHIDWLKLNEWMNLWDYYTVPPKYKLTVFFEMSIETRFSILVRIEESSQASSLSRIEKVMSLSLDWFLEKLMWRHILQGIVVAPAKENYSEKVLDIHVTTHLRLCSSSKKELAIE